MVTIDQNGRLLRIRGLAPADETAVCGELTAHTTSITPRTGYQAETTPLYLRGVDGLYCGAGFRVRIETILKRRGVSVVVKQDARHFGPAYTIDSDVLARFTPRLGQFESLLDLLASDCGVLVAPTGFGKSYLLTVLCQALPRARIDYVTYRADVCDQMWRDLSSVLPAVGRIGGGVYRPGRVQVVNVDSCHRTDYDADVLLGDEIHELAAPRFLEQLSRYGINRPCRAYGLTASLERDDGRHQFLEAIFGPVLRRIEYVDAQAGGLVVPITVRWVRPEVSFDPGSGLSAGARRERVQVWQNWARNDCIAAVARSLPADEQVMILVRSVEHAYALKSRLPEFEVCYAPADSHNNMRQRFQEAGLLAPEEPQLTPSRRRQLREDFASGRLRAVIATWVWMTGVNFKPLRWLIRADAAGSTTALKQGVGRLSRVADGKRGATLIDFFDHFAPNLLARSRARRRVYSDMGFAQETLDVPVRS